MRQQVRKAGSARRLTLSARLMPVRDKARRGVVVTDITLDVFLPEWIAAKTDIAPSTIRSYAGQIRNYVLPHLGHLRLDELRVAHVVEMLADVPGADATRQRVRASLRAALNDAVREGLICRTRPRW